MKNGKLHFKTRQEAEKYFRRLDKKTPLPFDKRFEKLEKKQQEHETRLNYIWNKILEINLKLK